MSTDDDILKPGDKVLVSNRRLFADDVPRYFAGEVVAYRNGIAKVRGHTWVKDLFTGTIQQREDERTRIISLASESLVIYQVPDSVDSADLNIELSESNAVFVTDSNGFKMDLTDRRKANA